MKYHYNLVIEDTEIDEEILVIKGTGMSRSTDGCYKAVRRTITQSIQEHLDRMKKNPKI